MPKEKAHGTRRQSRILDHIYDHLRKTCDSLYSFESSEFLDDVKQRFEEEWMYDAFDEIRTKIVTSDGKRRDLYIKDFMRLAFISFAVPIWVTEYSSTEFIDYGETHERALRDEPYERGNLIISATKLRLDAVRKSEFSSSLRVFVAEHSIILHLLNIHNANNARQIIEGIINWIGEHAADAAYWFTLVCLYKNIIYAPPIERESHKKHKKLTLSAENVYGYLIELLTGVFATRGEQKSYKLGESIRRPLTKRQADKLIMTLNDAIVKEYNCYTLRPSKGETCIEYNRGIYPIFVWIWSQKLKNGPQFSQDVPLEERIDALANKYNNVIDDFFANTSHDIDIAQIEESLS